jgi:hypothetical protein
VAVDGDTGSVAAASPADSAEHVSAAANPDPGRDDQIPGSIVADGPASP